MAEEGSARDEKAGGVGCGEKGKKKAWRKILRLEELLVKFCCVRNHVQKAQSRSYDLAGRKELTGVTVGSEETERRQTEVEVGSVSAREPSPPSTEPQMLAAHQSVAVSMHL